MKKIIYVLMFFISVVPVVNGASVTGFMTIDAGVTEPLEIAPDFFVDAYVGGSYFVMTENDPNASSAVMLQPGTLGAVELGTYQNFVLSPDIPAYDADGDGPLLPGSGYDTAPVVESDILAPFSFFGNPTYVGTNPISYQHGNAYDAPTADVDEFGNLTVDMSSWEVMWNGTAFEQGGIATGTYNALTGEYVLDWSSLIEGGAFSGVTGFWHLEGVISETSPVPVPAAVWLFGSGLIGLFGVARKKVKAA